MNRSNETDVLNTIYKNSRMAYDCTGQIISRCRNEELKDCLKKQREHYLKNCRSVRSELSNTGRSPHPVPVMQSVMARAGIFMKTMRDRSSSNIAEIMYNGTNMGIIDIARSVNHCENTSDKVSGLARTLLGEEESFANGLKRFL